MGQTANFLAVFGLISVLQIPSALGFSIVTSSTYQVIITLDGKKICGGTAISYNEIITAASCLFFGNLGGIEVLSFISDKHPFGKPHKVQDKCIPPNFKDNAQDHANDLVLLRLRDPIAHDDPNLLFSPIQMVEKDSKLKDGSALEITGYGFDQDNHPNLVEAIVTKMSYDDCRKNYSDVGGPTDDQFCAYSRKSDSSTSDYYDGFHIDFGACSGDGGVSATLNKNLVGFIANWKGNCSTNLGLPVIFTSIANHRDFIDNCRAMFAQREKDLVYAGPPKDYPLLDWLATGKREDTFWDKAKRVLSVFGR